MARRRTVPGLLPSHSVRERHVHAGVCTTRHMFEENARYCTDVTDGVSTVRVISGRLQVIGAAGYEAWAIGAGELVVLGGPGPYEIVAVMPTEMRMSVHDCTPRGPRLVFA